jgi:hypothetical protein
VKGLLLRLSALDADAEAAVRVIAYFDRLVESGATTREAVRATAALAECVVGWADTTGATFRVTPDGTDLPAESPGEPSKSVPVEPGGAGAGAGVGANGGRPAARVWLERSGASAPLDDLVLERLALTARLLGTARLRTPAPNLADPALVELVLAEREAREDRARAVHLLGLAAARPVRVLAVRPTPGQDPVAAAVALVCRGADTGRHRTVRVAAIGDVAAVLLQPSAGAESELVALRAAVVELSSLGAPAGGPTGGPNGGAAPANRTAPTRPVRTSGRATPGRTASGDAVPGRAGSGRPATSAVPGRDAVAAAALGGAAPPLEARRSWLQARLALRFATPGASEAFVDHDSLGTLALLAEVPPQRLRADPDVLALDALATTRAGAQDVAALDAFCRTGSLRQAAAELHLHHSSVAARLTRVEQAVGWRLDSPGDRFRARLALVARRLAGSA